MKKILTKNVKILKNNFIEIFLYTFNEYIIIIATIIGTIVF